MSSSPSSRLFKERERRTLPLETATWVARSLAESARPRPPAGRDDFFADPRAIDLVVTRYFDDVDRFKDENGFGDNRINEAKQAALTATQIMLASPIRVHGHVPDTVQHVLANCWYAYVVSLNLLSVGMDAVDDDIATETLFYLRHRHADVRTLMLIFELLRRTGLRRPPRRWWPIVRPRRG